MKYDWVLPLVLSLLVIIAWITNLSKLVDCDFKPDYKCEVVHAIGIIPAMSIFAVWVDSDE